MRYTIPLLKGGSQRIIVTMGYDISGFDVLPFDAHSALTDALDVSVDDAATGAVAVNVVWHESMPEREALGFRLRLVPKSGGTGNPAATPLLAVMIE